uniref:Interferon-induced protein with tetratricopeptide repeats n=1 Tax=Neogobius melanostomus TaxID=47308 RepID=A0A8C6SPL2_9GOBI
LSHSASPSKLHLEALQCHFTWDLSSERWLLLRRREKLLDICPEESNPWRGHIYNLLGFVQNRLGLSDEALSLFTSASEALRGPALLVIYSNLAWLHHERGETAVSHEYLMREPLHPEVLAEKAWTLMKFGPQQRRVAVELFEQALKEQPERVEWRSSQAIALMSSSEHTPTGLTSKELLQVQRAHEEDPENMFLAVKYLSQRAKRREQVEEEVAELVPRIIPIAHSSYSGLKSVLKYFRLTKAVDEAISCAEEALEKHPESRYVKTCAALCYKWRLVFSQDARSQPSQELIDRAVSLFREVVSLYPDSCLLNEIELANICAKSNRSRADAARIYNELLRRDLVDNDKQMLFNCYAKFLRHEQHDFEGSVKYHMRAAEIPWRSFYRANSIEILQRNPPRNDKLKRQVERFLRSLQDP